MIENTASSQGLQQKLTEIIENTPSSQGLQQH